MFRTLRCLIRIRKQRLLHSKKERKTVLNYHGFPEFRVENDCLYCLRCESFCPTNTIVFKKEGSRIIACYNMAECMQCFICREICPERRVIVIDDCEFATFDREEFRWSRESLADKDK